MSKKLKVTKVNKKKKSITIGNCVQIKSVPIIQPPIWLGEIIPVEEITKEELEKKYSKGSA